MSALPLEYPRGACKFDSMRCKKADINSQELDFDESADAYSLITLPPKAEVVKLKYDFSEAFNGSLKLGNASDDEAYIANADFPKSGSGIVMVNKLLTAQAAIILTVAGCTTGLGWAKLVWEV
jgi:hypothetical protein